MSIFNNPNRIPESYGLRIAGGLIAYFLVMNLIGLTHYVELRLVNIAIIIPGIYFALKRFRSSHQDHLNYFRALITGVATASFGSLVFALFIFVWMKSDVELMQAIKENEPMGQYLNPYIASFIVALEGVFSGLLFTFIIINYVPTDEVNDPQG
jgi:hypothetical protein